MTILTAAPSPGTAAARRFDLVTRAAGIGYWTLADGADRAEWDQSLREVHGLAPGQPVPRFEEWISRHLHAADREATRERFARWSHSGHADTLAQSFRIVRGDGEVRHLITQTQREAGPPASLFGVVVDVTDRVRAEEALSSARERVALAAHGAGLATWELDLDTGEAQWDEQMWLLRGREPRAGAMHPEERMACVHPDDRERVAAAMTGGTTSDEHIEYEFRIVRPDGQVRWLASRSSVLRDAQTGARRRIGVNWDVTEARGAAEARRESLAKSAFLARMSHELRTPLNAVLGFSQLLLADDAASSGADAARRRRHLELIRGAGQHLLELINDVLDLARVQGGELRVEREPVALGPVAAEAAALVDRAAVARGIAMRLEPGSDDRSVRVLADATRLRQVLINLLSNAVKYNRDGGRVELRAQVHGEHVAIEVEDSGRGFDPAQRAQLFEPFNRLDAERGPIEGTGIGLAIAKALVERMGGRIEAEGRPGEGSVFRVWLPAAASADTDAAGGAVRSETTGPLSGPTSSPSSPAAPGTAATPRPGSHASAVASASGAAPARLLYIEDNPVNALIVRELVALRPDLVLRVEATGLAGVAAATHWRPRLVLLDMQLPDIDGFEVLRRLRADEPTRATPVVALSANAMPADIQRALDAGLDDYWTKPLDVALFLQRLQRWFGPGPGRG